MCIRKVVIERERKKISICGHLDCIWVGYKWNALDVYLIDSLVRLKCRTRGECSRMLLHICLCVHSKHSNFTWKLFFQMDHQSTETCPISHATPTHAWRLIYCICMCVWAFACLLSHTRYDFRWFKSTRNWYLDQVVFTENDNLLPPRIHNKWMASSVLFIHFVFHLHVGEREKREREKDKKALHFYV